jgi:hypothetical protein
MKAPKKKQRSERFGTTEDATKKLQRADRFGLVDDATKKRQRAEKFGSANKEETLKKQKRLEKFGANRAPIGTGGFKNEERQKRHDRFKNAVSAHLS